MWQMPLTFRRPLGCRLKERGYKVTETAFDKVKVEGDGTQTPNEPHDLSPV